MAANDEARLRRLEETVERLLRELREEKLARIALEQQLRELRGS